MFSQSVTARSVQIIVGCFRGWGGGGEGREQPYIIYRYVPPPRVWFLGRFGLKTGIHFAYFVLESGLIFEGTTEAYERIYRFNSQ